VNEPSRGASGRSEREDFEQDLESVPKGTERRKLLAFAMRLAEERPVPRPGMRTAIRSMLLGRKRTSQARIGSLMPAYATAGSLMLVVAAAGLVGAGPFAA
jgi:hypothetical protein